MLWRSGRQSDNVEDRRGAGGFGGGGFGGGGMRMGGGIGGVGLLVVIVVGLFFGVDPATLLSQIEGGGSPGVTYQDDQQSASMGGNGGGVDDEEKRFVSVVLADTEDTWGEIFRQSGENYVAPHLVLFSGQIQSACGFAETAMGPFYCPADSKVYIDLDFYEELKSRFEAPGDFAQAYVIAHEVGHHVQHLLGTTDQVDRMQGGNASGANSLSVRVELQADCYAGVWAYHAKARNIVEPGDIDEALNAAAAVGDDRLQQQTQGRIVPDSFTHGTSEQRQRWFKAGFARGDPNACDTFKAKTL